MRKIWLISFILIISFSVFYIFQVNALAKEQVQVQGAGQKMEEFKSENEVLEMDFTKTNSLESLEGKIAELGLEKVERASYIRALETWVAVK